MDNSNSIKALLEDRFKFLYDKDFRVLSFDDYKHGFGDWQIIFQSSVCVIEIYSSQSEVDIIFIPANSNTDKRFGLSTFVYFISNGKEIVGNYEGDVRNQQDQIERLAKILKEYINEIILLIDKGISRHYVELEKVENAVFKIVYDEFRKKRYKPL